MARPDVPLAIPDGVDRHDLEAVARAILALPFDRPTRLFVDGTDVRAQVLPGACVVIDLLGERPHGSVGAVGLAAPATVSRHDGDEQWTGSVVHLVSRAGISVTAVAQGGDVTVFGPDLEPQTGRVPDACRRVLDLPTPPPTTSMTPFVFGAWLEVIGGRVDDETLDWPAIVAFHPAAMVLPSVPTPAEVAAATRELGESMEWDRFRRVIAAVGGFPFGPDGRAVAARADAGMFSRWAMDELPATVDALDRLARDLTPGAHDRVWATAHLCGAMPDEATMPDRGR